MTCDRCGETESAMTMSRFNTDNICEGCEDRGRKHPDYERACAVEEAAVKAGNYNFKGVGKPADL